MSKAVLNEISKLGDSDHLIVSKALNSFYSAIASGGGKDFDCFIRGLSFGETTMYYDRLGKVFVTKEEAATNSATIRKIIHRAIWFKSAQGVVFANYTSKATSSFKTSDMNERFSNHRNEFLDKKFINEAKLLGDAALKYIEFSPSWVDFIRFYRRKPDLVQCSDGEILEFALMDFFRCVQLSSERDCFVKIEPGCDNELVAIPELKTLAYDFYYNEPEFRQAVASRILWTGGGGYMLEDSILT